MIIDLLQKEELDIEKFSTAELMELKKSLNQVLTQRARGEIKRVETTIDERRQDRIEKNIRKNAENLAKLVSDDITANKVSSLLQLKKYQEAIEVIAAFDMPKRERPHYDPTRHTTSNINDVQSTLIYLALCDTACVNPETGNLINAHDAMMSYGVGHECFLPYVERLTEERFRDLIQNTGELEEIFWKVLSTKKCLVPGYTFRTLGDCDEPMTEEQAKLAPSETRARKLSEIGFKPSAERQKTQV